MTVEDRIELVDAALANLNEENQRRVIALIDGQYKDYPASVRGVISLLHRGGG